MDKAFNAPSFLSTGIQKGEARDPRGNSASPNAPLAKPESFKCAWFAEGGNGALCVPMCPFGFIALSDVGGWQGAGQGGALCSSRGEIGDIVDDKGDIQIAIDNRFVCINSVQTEPKLLVEAELGEVIYEKCAGLEGATLKKREMGSRFQRALEGPRAQKSLTKPVESSTDHPSSNSA